MSASKSFISLTFTAKFTFKSKVDNIEAQCGDTSPCDTKKLGNFITFILVFFILFHASLLYFFKLDQSISLLPIH